VNGAFLPCLVVQVQGTLPKSCIGPHTNQYGCNCQCDNSEPQEARITELPSMYTPKDRKMVSLSIPVLSVDSTIVSCSQICPHCPFVYYSIVQRPAAQLVTEITLWWWRMHVCQYTYILSVFPHAGCQVTPHLNLYIHVIVQNSLASPFYMV
jgi:hypothetical protein